MSELQTIEIVTFNRNNSIIILMYMNELSQIKIKMQELLEMVNIYQYHLMLLPVVHFRGTPCQHALAFVQMILSNDFIK